VKTQLIRPSRPSQTLNFATILPLFQTPRQTGLAASRPASTDLQLATPGRFARGPGQLELSGLAPKARLQELKSGQFSIPTVSGVMSRAAGTADIKTLDMTHMDLPFGMPRFVNVATLKKMLKASRAELMLKRVRDHWEICENSLMVDLTDDSVEFRIGLIQIFS
jgi:hypothetical protein